MGRNRLQHRDPATGGRLDEGCYWEGEWRSPAALLVTVTQYEISGRPLSTPETMTTPDSELAGLCSERLGRARCCCGRASGSGQHPSNFALSRTLPRHDRPLNCQRAASQHQVLSLSSLPCRHLPSSSVLSAQSGLAADRLFDPLGWGRRSGPEADRSPGRVPGMGSWPDLRGDQLGERRRLIFLEEVFAG
jgi:hypothetical protein